MKKSFLRFAALGVVAAALTVGPPAQAADAVKIGIMWPLTGNAAAAGQASKAAIEVALDIINNAHPELGNLPLAAKAGLPNLGGAKLEVTFVDHEGNPVDRAATGDAADHPGQGQRADGRLSIVLQLYRDGGRRALRHAVHGR